MNKVLLRKKILKRCVQVSGVVLSSIAAMWALYLVTPEPIENPSAGWENAYPLLIQRDKLPAEPETLIPLNDNDYVVSRNSAMVNITVFAGLEELPIGQVSSRLAPEDPRYDPYIQAAERFFVSPSHPDWEVLYYVTYVPHTQVRRHLAALQSEYPGGVLYTSNRSLPGWVRPVVFLSSLVFLGWGAYAAEKQRFWIALAGLPLIVTAHVGNPVVVCSLGVGFLIWRRIFLRFADRWRSQHHHPGMEFWDSARRSAAAEGVLLLVLPLGIGYFGEIRLVLVVMLGLVIQLAVTLLAWGWIQLQEQRRDHRLFLPILLRPKTVYSLNETVPFLLVLATGILFIALLGDGGNEGPGWQALKIPRPAEYVAADDVFMLASAAGELQSGSLRLPNLADFVAHRAFQTALVYGRQYGFPTVDEEVTILRAGRQGSALQQIEDQRVIFTREWISDTVLQHGPGSLEHLLLQQGVGTQYTVGTAEAVFFDAPVIRWSLILAVCALLAAIPLPKLLFFLILPKVAVAKSNAAA